MPLYVGSLCFLSIRSKTNTRSVGFLEYHIYHRPVRPVKTDSANVEQNEFVVAAGPDFLLFGFLRAQQTAL